ncbi:FtsW/RodA/SpoVE family cell cycle protein [Thermotoga maritima]|uniref:FtsW/RodA/SpoVE family cell cycle protein n=1 Tax=Thermotoga maritima TaxID=2336 RepID=UPI001D1262EB
MVVLVSILMLFGLATLRSATYGENEQLFTRQIVWDIAGFSLMFLVLFIKDRTIRNFSIILYVFSVVLLAALLVKGTPIGGSKRWFRVMGFSFQPSDFAKLSLIVLLPYLLEKRWFWRSFFLTVVPAVLIFLEPDLGTTLSVGLIWLFAVLASNVNKKPLVILLILVLVFLPVFFFFGLKDYQRARILSFLNPEEYGESYSYNVLQSIHAIGAGGLFGAGYMKGKANLMGYVPVSYTDFIVSVIGEEFGFIGIVFLLSLFGLLFFEVSRWILNVKDEYWEILMVSACGLIWFHVFENVSMNLGLLPVTGVPLPFISYGGTSTLVFSILVGLILKGIALARVEKKL